MVTDRLHPVVLYHVVNTLGWPGLRPLQEQAVDPILEGQDALLLAPTAGGKTEAAIFPVLSAMEERQWAGLSVLYVCPLKALLNNLEARVDGYASWLGRRAERWHGDVGQSKRDRMLRDRPDILLTTPESLEAQLVSTRVDPRRHFADVQAIVVDEVHAFAGDDRGWHLLAVLERIQRLAGRPIQRIGLSATVGNPDQLLTWLQGSNAGRRTATVVAPEAGTPALSPPGDITLDHVRSLPNAGKVIAALHAGEKRLVFCESRRAVEELAGELRDRGVTTYVSHSSLSADERRQAELAFAEARDCVIVSTSTLELGIDVGDLDRVIQVDAPRSVASFLQRLGRTGRRPGTSRNALFLATSDEALLRAAGLLHLWSTGFVEPVVPPPAPRHIVAQQFLALALQERRFGSELWGPWWNGLEIFDRDAAEILRWLVQEGHLEEQEGMLSIGPSAEARFGRRHFMDLVAVFTAAPEFTVIHGRRELGSVDPLVLTRKQEGPRIVVLAGRSFQVTHIDWKRRRCQVEPVDARTVMRWKSDPAFLSFELCQAQRQVLLGQDPRVTLSKRAADGLSQLRDDRAHTVSDRGLVVQRSGDDEIWWTYAGGRANATLQAALPQVVDPKQRIENHQLRLLGEGARRAMADASSEVLADVKLEVSPAALEGLKFSEVLPRGLAMKTLAERSSDVVGASKALTAPKVASRHNRAR